MLRKALALERRAGHVWRYHAGNGLKDASAVWRLWGFYCEIYDRIKLGVSTFYQINMRIVFLVCATMLI